MVRLKFERVEDLTTKGLLEGEAGEGEAGEAVAAEGEDALLCKACEPQTINKRVNDDR